MAEDNLKEIDEPEALEEEEEGGKEVDTSAIVEKQGEEDDVENENEEGLLKEEEEEGVEEAAAEEDKELSTEEGTRQRVVDEEWLYCMNEAFSMQLNRLFIYMYMYYVNKTKHVYRTNGLLSVVTYI